jgi:hypothetical protein
MKRAKQTKDELELAHSIFSIAIGEEESHPEEQPKDPKAVERGKAGGQKRAASLTPRKRKQIAKKAASARWTAKS